MKKFFFLLIVVCCSLFMVNAQDYQKIDSLKKVLNTLPSLSGTEADTLYMKYCLNIGDLYKKKLPDSAITWYENVYDSTMLSLKKEQVSSRLKFFQSRAMHKAGTLYYNKKNYIKAEQLWNNAVTLGYEINDSTSVAYYYYRIGMTYFTHGNYPEALNYFEQSLKLYETLRDSLGISEGLAAFAYVYRSQGNTAKAIEYYEKSLDIAELLGDKYWLSDCLQDLSNVFIDIGLYQKGLNLNERALAIRIEINDKQLICYSLNGLGIAYSSMKNFSKAIEYYEKSLKIALDVGDKMQVSSCYGGLGMAYYFEGNYQKSIEYFMKAKVIEEEYSSADRLSYCYMIWTKAFIKAKQWSDVISFLQKSKKLNIQALRDNFTVLSESEKEMYIKHTEDIFNMFNNLLVLTPERNDSLTMFLYDNSLFMKGLLLQSTQRILNIANYNCDTSITNSYNRLKQYRVEINQASTIASSEKDVKLLEESANAEERRLVKLTSKFSSNQSQFEYKWQDVQRKLNPTDVAIEFISFDLSTDIRFVNEIRKDTTLYYALVLRPSYKFPKAIRLCTDKELADVLLKTELYKTNSQVKGIKPIVNTYLENENDNFSLYNLIWKPLDSLLNGSKTVYVSLTGLLNKVSFNALEDENKQILLNKYNIHFLNSTRQLTITQSRHESSNKTIALFGGINYDLDTLQVLVKTDKLKIKDNEQIAMRSLSSDKNKENTWNYLGGTLTEVNNINKIFTEKNWKNQLYVGSNANEAAFKNLQGKNSPSIIHISTHGFFFPEPDSSTLANTRNIFKTNKNSLWRSGLIFAGGNYAWQCNPINENTEDGILTSYEVANTYLGNTDLVVLSACETGLGDIKSGEGVYGLQRAFQVAGAKAVIMSLWQVPDKETTELMTLFYESYIKTKNKHDSFRKAQQSMAKKYTPYYWAAFVLVE